MKTLVKTLFLAIILFVSLLSASAQQTVSNVELPDDIDLVISGTFAERRITGKVVGVHDGDTATVLDKDKTQYKFRFNGIDAPELKQDFGNKSKQHLSDLIFGKEVTVIFNKVDKYGRFVGKIMINGTDANLEQIKAGLAWHYKKYASEQSADDRKTYADAEDKARAAKLGFWAMPSMTPAWDYRAVKKTNQETEKANRKYQSGSRGGGFYINSSGNKTYVDKKFCATGKS
jgi:endonuclease YncB( thermonuclease family)